jgi:putative RecB family exonuclease
MVYPISATKLRSYQHCPYAYYLKYEKRVPTGSAFGAAALGNALHDALAQCHGEWHYQNHHPSWGWVSECWTKASKTLTNKQVREGRAILEQYYQKFIVSDTALRKPLAIEGKIQATIQLENLEFVISGRYDRIDYLDDGLELIDYKSAQVKALPEQDEIDLQLGLYQLALEQTYGQSLKYLSLLFLRTGEKVQYRADDKYQRKVLRLLKDLAWQVRHDTKWEPKPGQQCGGCSYAQYCVAVNGEPIPEPRGNKVASLQLAFSLSA